MDPLWVGACLEVATETFVFSHFCPNARWKPITDAICMGLAVFRVLGKQRYLRESRDVWAPGKAIIGPFT